MTHQPVTTIAFDAGYDTHEAFTRAFKTVFGLSPSLFRSQKSPRAAAVEWIRYDACVTVDETFPPQGDIGVQTIAGGVYGVTTHFGPYAKLNETYAKLMGQWLTRSGYEARSSPCFEVYLNDPKSTDPEDLITDIYVPVEANLPRK